jgi:hypothetical protein
MKYFMSKARIHNINKQKTSVLLLILSLGIFLRLYDINGESLWFDEGFYIIQAQKSLGNLFSFLSIGIHHSPLYFFSLHYWVSLFGDSVISTRGLSAVYGFFTLVVMYRISTFIFNKHVAFISTFLLSVSVFHIAFSQEVKGYSLLALLSLLSMHFFIKLIDTLNLKNATAYITASTFLLYTHYFSFFIIAAQNIYLLTIFLFSQDNPKLSFKKWGLLQCILIFLYTPWMIWILKDHILPSPGLEMRGITSFPSAMKSIASLSLSITERTTDELPLVSFNSLIHTFSEYAGSYFLMCFFALLIFFSFFKMKRTAGSISKKNLFTTIENCTWNIEFSHIKRALLLLLWLFIPVVLPFLVSFLYKPIYETRYTVAASLPFYILLAKGIEKLENKYLQAAIIIIIAFFSLGNIQEYYTKVQKQQWREVARYIDKNARYGDTLFFYPGYTRKAVFNYYSKRKDFKKKRIPYNLKFEGINPEKVELITEGYKSFWLVVSFNYDPQGYIKNSLQSLQYKIKSFKKFDGNLSLQEWKIIEVSLIEKSTS